MLYPKRTTTSITRVRCTATKPVGASSLKMLYFVCKAHFRCVPNMESADKLLLFIKQTGMGQNKKISSKLV